MILITIKEVKRLSTTKVLRRVMYMTAMGRGCGKTPENVVIKITEEVTRIGQNATAKAIGIPLRSVQKYLKGGAEPTSATFQKLADYFEVSVAYLRGEDPATLKGKTPIRVVKRLKEAVSEKGECRVAEETGITQSEIHRFLLGVGWPTNEAFKKLSDYFGTRLGIAPIAEFDDFYAMDKMLVYVDTEIGFLIDEEVTALDSSLIRFLLGFAKMITDLPVGMYTSSISNDELVAIDERARMFIDKFQKLLVSKKPELSELIADSSGASKKLKGGSGKKK